MNPAHEYLIGVDGGGTGTRLRVTRPDGSLLGAGSGGPSSLANGVAGAWQTVLQTLTGIFTAADVTMPAFGRMAIGLGLAGVHNRQWAAEFRADDPGFACLALDTDGFTTLLGAHGGEAGAVIAIGTGSIGEIWDADGQRREVGGWGFPSSDEAGGAWLGMLAVNHAQRILDGRARPGRLGLAVIEYCGGSADGLRDWLAQARQTQFAALAPLVLRHAPEDDVARGFLIRAGEEIARMANALDRQAGLPLALCGGLALPLQPFLPAALQRRVCAPQADAVTGALTLLRHHLGGRIHAR